jgi:hypothetical protein
MYDLLKLLNDRSAGDLAELDNDELQRFETLCENWRTFVEAERARRKSLPRPIAGSGRTHRQNRDRRPPVVTSSLLKVSVIERP